MNQSLRMPTKLRDFDYEPPLSPAECLLDVVTPSCNRQADLLQQAERIGLQLGDHDRWIVVDDASDQHPCEPRVLAAPLPTPGHLLYVALAYFKDGPYGSTLNRARHVACTLARPDAWIVEVDDHDRLSPDCLAFIREAIVSGATFVYGDVVHIAPSGMELQPYIKPDYRQWLLRDEFSPCEGVRAYPKWLYDAVGGYRWYGERDVGGNEWPAGDYGLFMRMEQLTEGFGFCRIPRVLCHTVKHPAGISGKYQGEQAGMAAQLRAAAAAGVL